MLLYVRGMFVVFVYDGVMEIRKVWILFFLFVRSIYSVNAILRI